MTPQVDNFSSIRVQVLGAIGSDDRRLMPLKCTMANEEANGLETGLRAAGLDRRAAAVESQATRAYMQHA